MVRVDFAQKGRAVHLFQPLFRTEEVLNQVKECLEAGWTGDGFKTNEFERLWEEYTECDGALFLNSSTSGLFMCFEMLKEKYGWDSNTEVITTPLTFISTNHAIMNAGLIPIFADIDSSLNLSPESVLLRITQRTKAVIFVGIGGNPHNYHSILRICRENNLLMILDAAHMAGTKYNNKQIGHDADFSIFSFQAVKNCPTSDSGLIHAKEKDDQDLLKARYWLGINKSTFERSKSTLKYKWQYDVDFVSNKYNGNSIAAALGIVSLKYLDQDNAYRRKLASAYNEKLAHVRPDLIRPIPHLGDGNKLEYESSRHLYQISLGPTLDRDQFIIALNSRMVFPGVHYISNKRYTPYAALPQTDTSNADKYSGNIISLPLHLRMSEKDVEFVCEALSDCLRELIA